MENKKIMLIPAAVILLVLISGCTGFPNLFGGDVLNVQNVVTKDKTVDVMTIKDIITIPHSPLLPNQPVMLSFLVENRDDLKSLKDVAVDMYNAPLFKNEQEEPCNLYKDGASACQPYECDVTYESCCSKGRPCDILPGEERMIRFNMFSPTNNEIVNIKTQEKLDFRVSYDFNGSLLYTVPVVNMEEIINRQRQGAKTNVQISKAHSSGPIQIDVDLFGSPYILSEYGATFLFKITNKGSGVLKGANEIEKEHLVIEFPAELVNGRLIDPGGYKYNLVYDVLYEYPYTSTGFATTDTTIGSTPLQPARDISDIWEDIKPQDETTKQFDCTYAYNVVRCTNLKPIPLYKDETRMSLRFEMPKTVKVIDPFKSYEIRAYVGYTYELRSSVDVTINPYGNV